MADRPRWQATRRGTMLRGPRGKIYILPDEALREFEVKGKEHLDHARALMEQGSEEDGGFKFAAPEIWAVGHVVVPDGYVGDMVVGWRRKDSEQT